MTTKCILLLVIVAVLTRYGSGKNSTSKEIKGYFSCLSRECGLYADEENCHGFYQCIEDKAVSIHRLCHHGFRYNRNIQICDYPHNVQCDEKPRSTDYFRCNETINCGRYLDTTNCKGFFECIEDKTHTIHRICREGLGYNHNTQNCDYPHLFSCTG